ncbi:aldo/keto reductase [Actinomadura rupiterrae]|uniref:aldo/keto reductase n=1 Tax=Actinomadura rupiterrae TaxID=559627 RepID=UPI0020A4C213|nr:aldo/keto reductase [Actinomadura rupiterrae]MCP2342283.1 aryl-alcohol dehydrogenase-like predicted oxidoreductase [Actinomadura rupiterrae]
MRMTTLGGTGIKVSRYCLGTMNFDRCEDPGDPSRLVDAALDAGINFVDTADAYGRGEVERLVGRALKGRRDDVVLATKVFFPMGEDPNMAGGSRRWITRAVEDSLRRLDTDYIDLYQLHRPDPATDIDETLSVLSDLVRAGKVRAIGTSTFPAEQIVEAQWVSERRNHVRFRCEQMSYSMLVRGPETSVLPTCRRYGVGAIAWSPLAGGFLTGRYRKQQPMDLGTGRAARYPQRFDPSPPGNARKLEAVEELLVLAEQAGCSLTHLAMAFVLAHPAITSAIIGPRTPAQLADLLDGADLRLDDDVLDRIDQIIEPGTTLNRADAGSQLPPSLTDASLRRHPFALRGA